MLTTHSEISITPDYNFYGPFKKYAPFKFQTLAHLISNIFNPVTAIVALCIAAVMHIPAVSNEWLWLLFVMPILALPPVAYIVWLMKRGEVVDIHIPNRRARLKPLAFTLIWLALWAALLPYLGMPAIFVLLLKGVLLLFALLSLITLVWKISFHTAMISMLAAVVATVVGLLTVWSAAAVLLIILVAWARISLRRHTLAQSLAGSLTGAIAGYFLFVSAVMQMGIIW